MSDHENVGYLTWDEFDRFQKAVHNSQKVIPWFRVAGYIKGGVEEVRAPSSNHPIGIPPTWLAAEEITRLSRELRYWANLEDVANDDIGAMTARDFTREVETAMARWPIEDKPRKVRHIRCQGCAGETIRYTPPVGIWQPVKIACTECARTYTEEEFKTLVELVNAEIKRTEEAIGRTRRMGAA